MSDQKSFLRFFRVYFIWFRSVCCFACLYIVQINFAHLFLCVLLLLLHCRLNAFINLLCRTSILCILFDCVGNTIISNIPKLWTWSSAPFYDLFFTNLFKRACKNRKKTLFFFILHKTFIHAFECNTAYSFSAIVIIILFLFFSFCIFAFPYAAFVFNFQFLICIRKHLFILIWLALCDFLTLYIIILLV